MGQICCLGRVLDKSGGLAEYVTILSYTKHRQQGLKKKIHWSIFLLMLWGITKHVAPLHWKKKHSKSLLLYAPMVNKTWQRALKCAFYMLVPHRIQLEPLPLKHPKTTTAPCSILWVVMTWFSYTILILISCIVLDIVQVPSLRSVPSSKPTLSEDTDWCFSNSR